MPMATISTGAFATSEIAQVVRTEERRARPRPARRAAPPAQPPPELAQVHAGLALARDHAGRAAHAASLAERQRAARARASPRRVEHAGHRAAAHHARCGRSSPSTSGNSDEIIRIATPCACEVDHQRGGSRPWRRRRRPASARRGSARAGSSAASARAQPSAGCRPTASTTVASIDGGLMPSSLTKRSARLRARGRGGSTRQSPDGCESAARRDVRAVTGIAADHAVAAPILGHVRDAVRDRLAPACGCATRAPSMRISPRVGRREAEHGARRARSGRRRRGRRARRSPRRRRRDVTPRTPRLRAATPRIASTLARLCAGGFGYTRPTSRGRPSAR